MADLNIVVAGSAGEGVQTIGDMLADTVAAYGYAVFAWQEFESRIRGGQNRYSIRIGETPASAPLMAADILLALNRDAVEKYAGLLTQTGVLIGPGADREPMIALDFSTIAKQELGNRIYASTIAFGALAAAVGIPSNLVAKVAAARFAGKDEKIVAGNRAAAQRGYQAAGDGCRDICPWQLPPGTKSYYLMAGYQALATAAVRAGCRFMAAYPMSPATGIITFLAGHEQDLGVFVEQAEDEIAAVNMAIGAGFGGARAHDRHVRGRVRFDDGGHQPGRHDRNSGGHCPGPAARPCHRAAHPDPPREIFCLPCTRATGSFPNWSWRRPMPEIFLKKTVRGL